MPNNKDNKMNAELSRTYKGKEYSLIDINNLKEANNQMAKIIKQQSTFIAKIDEQKRKKIEISIVDQNLYNSYKKQEASMEKMARTIESNNKKIKAMTNNWNRFITDTVKHPSNQQEITQSIIRQNSRNREPIPNNISQLFSRSLTNINNARLEGQINRVYQDVAERVSKRYKDNNADFTNPRILAKMDADIKNETILETADLVKKFGKSVDLMDVAAKTFSKAISVWTQIFSAGLGRQTEAYESTFTGLSIRNGITRQNYYDTQLKLNNRLGYMGLRNNIGSSEVQLAWSKMSENGIRINMSDEKSRAEITAKAIENVLTNSVVPYLDTNTAQWDQLIKAQPDLQKNIRGINRLNAELVGNNYATQDLVQSILDDLQPISESALSDLAMSATGASTFINSMMASGMDKATAENLWKEYYKQQSYGAEILRSGSVSEKMSLHNAMLNGINLYDARDTGYALGNIASTRSLISGWGTGYGNTINGIVQSVVNSATGIDPKFAMWEYSHRGNTNNIITDAISTSNRAINEMEKYGELVSSEFIGDKNQTNKKLQDITVENMANEFAFFNEWLGNWAGVIKEAIEGIGMIIMSKIVLGGIGKGISSLLGAGGQTLSQTSGLGGLFNPLTIGITSLVALAAGIHSAVNSIRTKERTSSSLNASSYASNFTTGYGDSNNAGQLAAYSQSLGGGYTGSAWSAAKGKSFFKNWLGSMDNLYLNLNGYDMDNPADYNKEKWDRAASQSHDIMSPLAWQWANVWYALGILDAGNSTDVMEYATKLTPDGIKAFLYEQIKDPETKQKSLSSEYFGRAMQYLDNMDLYPVGPNRAFSDLDYTIDQFKEWGVYRNGLNLVPYDNYPALLHKGETILTSATANELRNLLDEYRQTSQQAVNFDTIIQQQTSDLINKMNEIIGVIDNGNSYFTHSNRQNSALNKLSNSMKYIESTKAY